MSLLCTSVSLGLFGVLYMKKEKVPSSYEILFSKLFFEHFTIEPSFMFINCFLLENNFIALHTVGNPNFCVAFCFAPFLDKLWLHSYLN